MVVKTKLIGLILLCKLLFPLLVVADTGSPLTVISRENYQPRQFSLQDSDWRWLGEKREVKIGVWQPEIPPLDLFTETGAYEGMTADYIMLISHRLGLRVSVQAYADRNSAIGALVNKDVDMVVDPSGKNLPENTQLGRTQNFISDHPVLVHRKSLPHQPFTFTKGMSLAIARWYVDDAWIEKNFPGARIMHFDTDEQAMASVAFNENDFYVGNLVTTSYLLGRNFSAYLELQGVYPERDTGSHFLVRNEDTVLLRALNQALSAIPHTQTQVILQQWSEGAELWRVRQSVQFTDKERRWIKNHPSVGVSVNSFYAPFTMNDMSGSFYGATADILRLVSLRTGIHFRPVAADSLKMMEEQIRDREALFIGAISPSDERSQSLQFTRPYFKSPFVMVERTGSSYSAILPAGTRVAVAQNNSLISDLIADNPGIRITEVGNASLALQMVDDGKADIAVHNLFGASYMIDRYFRDRLRIKGQISAESASISFGISRQQPELLSILNKTLENISPSDIASVVEKWQTRPDVRLDTWELYKTQFWLLLAVAAAIILITVAWIYYLRREVRARKHAQQKLRTQLAFSETLINSLPLPVYVADRHGNVLLSNASLQRFFKGEKKPDLTAPLDNPDTPLHDLWNGSRRYLDPSSPAEEPAVVYSRIHDGEQERSIFHTTVPYRDAHSHIDGLICTLTDVTEHEVLTRALSDERERAEQANRAKSTFLATMSHEIRTPVSAIIGLLELAVNTGGKENEQEDPVRVAWESARSLMGLIGDILDMARIESGRLELSAEWLKTTELLPPVLRVFEGLARQKSLRMRCTLPPVMPYSIFIDPLRFRQILSNLISNAIKFTERGNIDVDMDIRVNETQDSGTLTIQVTDTGKGISEEERKDIFDPWVQAKNGRVQNSSGLGLAICSQLVQMMGGDITMTSLVGQGTRVVFSIPVEISQQRPEKRPEVAEHTAQENVTLRILAVDDHPTNRMLLRRQLAHLGHAVTEAKDGDEAWSLCQSQQFDVVITDCSMPGMDGLALTRLIRSHTQHRIIVLGLTANAWPEERNRCLQAGMDDCLFKPLQLTQLRNILNEAVKTLQIFDENNVSLEKLLNYGNLLALCHNDIKMLHELLTITLQSNREDIELAADLFELQDWPELAKCIHRISGAAQIIGARHAEEQCRLLEMQSLEAVVDEKRLSNLWASALSAVEELNKALVIFLNIKEAS